MMLSEFKAMYVTITGAGIIRADYLLVEPIPFGVGADLLTVGGLSAGIVCVAGHYMGRMAIPRLTSLVLSTLIVSGQASELIEDL